MPWNQSDGWLWLDVENAQINDYQSDATLALGVNLLQPKALPPGNPAATVLALPVRQLPTAPYVAPSVPQARQLAGKLIGDVQTLHARGIRLHLEKTLTEPAGLVQLVTVLREDERKPIEPYLVGGVEAWEFGAASQPKATARLPRGGGWPCRAESWQRRFAEAVAAADPTAYPDWQGVLRAIYYHRTAARLPAGRRTPVSLLDHARRTKGQLEASGMASVLSWLMTADADILYWGSGSRGTYRRWLHWLQANSPRQ